MSTIIGIDLGTSTTEAAVIRDGRPVMIMNLEQEIITPSAVGLDGSGNWVVGEKARAQYLLSPENTAIEVKRKIGTNEKIMLGKQSCTPVGLSARLLGYVKTYVSEYLGEEVTRAVDPDYAVAQGAAIQAGIIEGTIHQEDSIMMTDVNPYTLGIRVMDGLTDDRMSVIIPRNVTIPVTRSEVYFTSRDYQTQANIEVYQGESSIAGSNHFLGDFTVKGIPPKKAGSEKIGVKFSYDMNGMLKVRASILSTGTDASIEINMMENSDTVNERIDVSRWKESSYAKQFRTVIRRAERALKSPEVSCDLLLKEELEDCLYDLKAALVEEKLEDAREAEEDLIDLLDELK